MRTCPPVLNPDQRQARKCSTHQDGLRIATAHTTGTHVYEKYRAIRVSTTQKPAKKVSKGPVAVQKPTIAQSSGEPTVRTFHCHGTGLGGGGKRRRDGGVGSAAVAAGALGSSGSAAA